MNSQNQGLAQADYASIIYAKHLASKKGRGKEEPVTKSFDIN